MALWKPRRPRDYAEQTYANPYWLIRYPHRKRFQMAAELLLTDEPRVLLDYGAGDGEMLAHLLEDPRAERIRRVIAYDPVPVMQEHARTRMAPWSDRATVIGDLEELESALDGQQVDTIACLEVLEHLSWRERQLFYKFCVRHLAEGGLCLVDVPVEIGPALLIKQFGRQVLKGRPRQYGVRELASRTLGIRSRDPQRFDATREEGWIQDHQGFDYRLLEDELRNWMPVERSIAAPVKLLPPWLCNQEVFIVARGRQMLTNGDKRDK